MKGDLIYITHRWLKKATLVSENYLFYGKVIDQIFII